MGAAVTRGEAGPSQLRRRRPAEEAVGAVVEEDAAVAALRPTGEVDVAARSPTRRKLETMVAVQLVRAGTTSWSGSLS